MHLLVVLNQAETSYLRHIRAVKRKFGESDLEHSYKQTIQKDVREV